MLKKINRKSKVNAISPIYGQRWTYEEFFTSDEGIHEKVVICDDTVLFNVLYEPDSFNLGTIISRLPEMLQLLIEYRTISQMVAAGTADHEGKLHFRETGKLLDLFIHEIHKQSETL